METQIKTHTFQTQNITFFGRDVPTISKIVGVSWILMFFIAIPTVLLILEKLIIKTNISLSVLNIQKNPELLYFGIVSYFVILVLDTFIAVGLFPLFKDVNRKITISMSTLRIFFVLTTAFSLLALLFFMVETYILGILVGYLFLIPHLFILGYLSIKSDKVFSGLGWFMIIASFSYVITIFGGFFIPVDLLQILYPIAMIPASLAELSMGIYLIIKSKNFTSMN